MTSRFIFALPAILLLLATGGCAGKKPPVKASDATQAKKPAKAELPGQLTGKGWHISWLTRDPKNPNGPQIPVLSADADRGEIMNTATPALRLWNVHARMFHNGIQSANITAPQVTASQGDWIFIGTGGVTVESLTDPPDTVITGDKVTWNMKIKRLLAEGHARLTHRAPDGKVSMAEGNRITFDTALKTSTLE
jgi:hypothetical protein